MSTVTLVETERTNDADAIQSAVSAEVEAFLALIGQVKANKSDSVHKMRVSLRRLRSVLGSCRELYQRNHIRRVRRELRWLAQELGTARDAEVLADRFGDEIDELSSLSSADRKRLYRLLVKPQLKSYKHALKKSRQVFATKRFRRLTTALRKLANQQTEIEVSGASALQATIASEYERLTTEAASVEQADASDAEDLLHSVRKSAKRLRYLAEAATPALGDEAADLAQTAKDTQSVLGDHRDAIQAHTELTQTFSKSSRRNSPLADIETSLMTAAEQALADYPATLARLRTAVNAQQTQTSPTATAG